MLKKQYRSFKRGFKDDVKIICASLLGHMVSLPQNKSAEILSSPPTTQKFEDSMGLLELSTQNDAEDSLPVEGETSPDLLKYLADHVLKKKIKNFTYFL